MKLFHKIPFYDFRPGNISHKWNKEWFYSFIRELLVKLYRNTGIFILIFFLFLILGYFLMIGFFFLNRHWVVPFILNPFSEKVLTMRKQHMDTVLEVDTLETRRFLIEKKVTLLNEKMQSLDQLIHDMDQIFLQEVAEKKVSLQRLDSIYGKYQKVSQVLLNQKQPALLDAQKMHQQIQDNFKRGLLSTNQYLQSQGELWQNQSAQIDFDLKMHDLERRIQQTKKELNSMSKMDEFSLPTMNTEATKIQSKDKLLSYEMLLMRKKRDEGIEEKKNMQIEIQSLNNELIGLKRLINEQRDFSRILVQSPYFRAFGQNMVLGFVPYEHLKNINPHDEIYACKFKLFWCDRIGQVKKIIEGEVIQTHPFFSKEMRGKIVEMELHQVNLGQNDILHIERPPLFFIF